MKRIFYLVAILLALSGSAFAQGQGGSGGGGGGSVPTGPAGTPNASVITVQGAAGGAGTPIPVSATFSGAGDTTGGSGALGALNAAITVALAGDNGASLHIPAGTLVGTIVPELSYDGGTTYPMATSFVSANGTISASVVFGSSNTATDLPILLMGGATNARVRVSAYTSGTVTGFLKATSNMSPFNFVTFPTTPTVTVGGTLPAFASTPAFSISGTLPAFAATPTFNLGTLNGAALDASVTGLEVTQGSTTSGQKGILSQCAVTTGAPTYTTAQTSPLSCDTSGNVRVTVTGGGSNAAAGATGSAVPASADYSGINIGGTLRGQTGVNPTGSQFAADINIASAGGVAIPADVNGTLQSAAVANGNGTTLTVGGLSSVMFTANLSGASGGTTLNFEATEDGSNWTPLQVQQVGTNTIATTTTTAGITWWMASIGSAQTIRTRISSYSAGTITVTAHASAADFVPLVANVNVQNTPAITIADGSSATLGSKADNKNAATDTTAVSVVSLLKEISSLEQAPTSRAVTNVGTFAVQASPAAVTAGGATPFYYISGASNNSTNKKASAGQLYSVQVINTTATLKYIRFYDSSTAPTCTSNTGAVFYSPIPANSTTGAGFISVFPVGAQFVNGIGWCITGGAGDTDNTSTAAGDVILAGTIK